MTKLFTLLLHILVMNLKYPALFSIKIYLKELYDNAICHVSIK